MENRTNRFLSVNINAMNKIISITAEIIKAPMTTVSDSLKYINPIEIGKKQGPSTKPMALSINTAIGKVIIAAQ